MSGLFLNFDSIIYSQFTIGDKICESVRFNLIDHRRFINWNFFWGKIFCYFVLAFEPYLTLSGWKEPEPLLPRANLSQRSFSQLTSQSGLSQTFWPLASLMLQLVYPPTLADGSGSTFDLQLKQKSNQYNIVWPFMVLV